jgi:PDZ domain-containing secreted protein
MNKNVNVVTEIASPQGKTHYEWKNFAHLSELQRAATALLADLSNTGGQVASGVAAAAAQDPGPFDKSLTLGMTVTHPDGTGHHSLQLRYDNMSDAGVGEVMRKVEHHLAPFKATAHVTKAKH